MSIRLGDIAPDFEQDSSEGRIRFHDWLGDSWGVLFSHPADFTPVCTTELGFTAKLKDDFDARDVKVIGLSVDSTGDHERWAADIEETQGTKPNFPLIGDASGLKLDSNPETYYLMDIVVLRAPRPSTLRVLEITGLTDELTVEAAAG